jgi:hypothetical protein
VSVVSQMFVLFKVLIGQNFEIEFIKVRNQRVLLKKLAITKKCYTVTKHRGKSEHSLQKYIYYFFHGRE